MDFSHTPKSNKKKKYPGVDHKPVCQGMLVISKSFSEVKMIQDANVNDESIQDWWIRKKFEG